MIGEPLNILSKIFLLNDIGYEVIGIAAAQLMNPESVDIYAPFGFYADRPYLTDRDDHPGLYCIGRLRQDVSVEQAAADLAVISKDLESRYPDTNAGDRIKLTSLLEGTVGQYRMTAQ